MSNLWSLLDSSAYARGGHGGYSSCHYNCGWDILTAFALFLLVILLYQAAKFALTQNKNAKDIGVSALILLACAGVAIGALFIGPLLMLGGIIAVVIALFAWGTRTAR
jgi:hypothetical protein